MEDKRITCSVCAWRATCKKRFMQGGSFALHCPDFTFDLTLKEREEDKEKHDNTGSK